MSTSASFGDALCAALAGVVAIGETQLEALARHYELLLRWNRRLNLTTVTDPAEAAVRHYAESLFLAARLTAGSVVDIGAGAGFPGVPAAILRPDCTVTLAESHSRKCVFLREAVRHMANASVICRRAEDLDGGYDWMISRAVAVAALAPLRVARRFALLVGADDASALRGVEVTALPWGARRVLVIGDVPLVA
jgi:16S rRNA G527 N7-methylase RsmG